MLGAADAICAAAMSESTLMRTMPGVTVRRIEVHAPEAARDIAATVARLDRVELAHAISQAVGLYRRLRATRRPPRLLHEAETLACEFLQANGIATHPGGGTAA